MKDEEWKKKHYIYNGETGERSEMRIIENSNIRMVLGDGERSVKLNHSHSSTTTTMSPRCPPVSSSFEPSLSPNAWTPFAYFGFPTGYKGLRCTFLRVTEPSGIAKADMYPLITVSKAKIQTVLKYKQENKKEKQISTTVGCKCLEQQN